MKADKPKGGLQGRAKPLLCPGAPQARRTPKDDSPKVGERPAEQSGAAAWSARTRRRCGVRAEHRGRGFERAAPHGERVAGGAACRAKRPPVRATPWNAAGCAPR